MADEELYVYYRLAARDAAAALSAIAAAGLALRWPQVRLLRRSQEAAGLQTWMEVHRGPAALASEAEYAQALRPFLSGERHTEKFVPIGL